MTVVDDVDVTYDTVGQPGNVPLTLHLTYHDQATYTLSGTTPRDGLSASMMTGSGVGKLTGTSSQACYVPQDPLGQWSFNGAANVSISYVNGAFLVQPQPVDATGTTVSRWTACPASGRPDETVTGTGPHPFLAAQLRAGQLRLKGQAAPETTTSLSGSEAIPITYLGEAGTATLTWNLTRTPAPPSGTPSGRVLVNGKPYKAGQPIPYGSTVDVTHGRLTLTTEAGTLTVYGLGVSAVFKLLKFIVSGKVVVELRMEKGNFGVCSRALASYEKKPPANTTTVRRLYAKGKGAFRTRGRYASAAVRGTFWLTADRCDGTLTSVKRGIVQVQDFVKHKKVLVKAGQSYLAAKR